MTDYFAAGKRVRLGQVLGEGGEAVVYLDDNDHRYACKLYKPGASAFVTDLRAHKIDLALRHNLPDVVYGPVMPITNKQKHGHIVGFKMRLFPDGYLNLEDLADRSVWTNYGLSQRSITTIFKNLHALVAELHASDIVVGDFSAMNFQFHPQTLAVIACDVDSWQFGADSPCVIGTMDFLAPRQYNKDLDSGQHPFLPEDDWWGFTVNLFRSLLRVHPFREGKTGIARTADRVLQGLHVLNPALPYPPVRVALPLTSLPDRTLALFKQIFAEQHISEFPADELAWLADQWVVSTHYPDIEVVYARERSECPHFARDRSVPDLTRVTVLPDMVNITEIYAPTQPRRVVFAAAVGVGVQDLIVLGVDASGGLVAVRVDHKRVVHEFMLPIRFAPGQHYSVSADSILVADANGQVQVFDTADGELKHEFETQTYMGRPVTALATEPIWLVGAAMVRGERLYGQLQQQTLMKLTYGNVWFTASQFDGNDIVVGFTNLFGTYQWFAYVDGLFHELRVVKTEPGAVLLDWRVVFDGAEFAIIRRVETQSGSSKVTVDLLAKSQHLGSELLPVDRLEGLPALRSSLLYPTENGVLRIKPGQTAAVLPGTESVSPASLLVAVREGADGHLHLVDETTSTIYRVTR